MIPIHLAQILPLECQMGYRNRQWGGIFPPGKTCFKVPVALPPHFVESEQQESGKGLWTVPFLLEHRGLQPVGFGKDVLRIFPSSPESTGDKTPWS